VCTWIGLYRVRRDTMPSALPGLKKALLKRLNGACWVGHLCFFAQCAPYWMCLPLHCSWEL